MPADNPRPKRRKPPTTPEPLFIVPGLPAHIDLIRHADCFVLRCGRCGEQERHGLPVMSSELQRVATEFAGRHGHEARFTDDQIEQLWQVAVFAYRAMTEFGSDRTYTELPETFWELDHYLANVDDELRGPLKEAAYKVATDD